MRIFKLAFNKLRSNGDQLKFIESHSPEQLLRQGMQLCRMFGPIQNGILSGHGPQLDLGGKNDSCITPQMLRDKKIRRRINRILSEDVLLSVVACRSGDLNAGLARSLSEMSKVAAVHASDANVSRWQLESFESSAKAKHLIRFIGAPTRIFRGGDMVALSDPHTLHEAVSA